MILDLRIDSIYILSIFIETFLTIIRLIDRRSSK